MYDKFDTIFELQKRLNTRIGAIPENPSDAETQRWILDHARAISQELAELTDSVPWKWWARYQKFDRENVLVEVVDILHFLVSMCVTMGVSSSDLFELYQKKHAVNMDRQEAGYTHKDESDNDNVRLHM